MIILEVCTYYNDTWTRSSNSVWVMSHCVISFFLAFVVTTAIATLFLVRLMIATICSEQSRGWIFYTTVSILAVPLWFMGEMVNAWLF